jgi:hydroxymethylbilane synthase
MSRSNEPKALDRVVLACEHSPLIIAYARIITEQLGVLYPKLAVEVRPSRGQSGAKQGNPVARRPFGALQNDSVHAVLVFVEHLPTELPSGLEIPAVCERLAPFQGLVSSNGRLLDDLPQGARVGVSDNLIRFQLSQHRSDLNGVLLRQALARSLPRVRSGRLDALIAPVAEMELLGWQNAVTEVLDGSMFLPPVGRGAVALVSAESSRRSRKWLTSLDDSTTRSAVGAERALLMEMNGLNGYLGALALVSGKTMNLEGAVWSRDGKEVVRESLSGEVQAGIELGKELAERLYEHGADRLRD